MAAEKTQAIVLKMIEFSETSCIVTLFTEGFGKVGALAKGARRPKGPFEGAIDLLALIRIVFLRKSSEALDLLTEAKLDDGTWLDVLELTRSSGTHVVVTDAWADARFWATAINLGAYDLLAQPFRRTEAQRVLACASLRPLCVKVGAVDS